VFGQNSEALNSSINCPTPCSFERHISTIISGRFPCAHPVINSDAINSAHMWQELRDIERKTKS